MIFWLGVLVILMAHCTDLLGVSGGKATRNAGENPISTMELWLTWHVRPENISLPITTIAGFDWAGLWLGLPDYWTSDQWTSSYWATLKPWFICHQLILNRILLSVSLRQQQSGIFECVCQSLLHCCQLCIKLVAICLDICSKLVWNTTFFQNTLVICLISKLSQTHFESPWHCKDAGLTCSCLGINLCFGPFFHLTKFRRGVFPHSICLGQILLTKHLQIFIVALWCVQDFNLSWPPILNPLFWPIMTGSGESGWDNMAAKSAFSTLLLLHR
jgi:hypothetical protein